MQVNTITPDFLADRTQSSLKQNDQELKKACADFEAVLLNYMFSAMQKTLPGDALFGKSLQQDITESMYFQELSTKIAHERGLGMGEMLYRQLSEDRQDAGVDKTA